MEHRLSARLPLNTSVAIYYSSLGLLQGQAVDVSRHGIFIRTGSFIPPLHALVELVFPLEQRADTISHRTPAMVVRVSEKGAAFMFGNEMDVMDIDEISSDGSAPAELEQYYKLRAS